MNRREFLKSLGLASAGALSLRGILPPSAAGAARPVYLVPERIPADGSADVTGALTRFIRRVPDGSVIRFPHRGRYRIEGTVRVAGRKGLVLDGNEATLFATTVGIGTDVAVANRAHLRFDDCFAVVVRRFRIRGVNPQPGVFDPIFNSQHGIHLSGVDGARVRDCTITDVYGDSVYLESYMGDGSVNPCRNVHVTENLSVGNGRQAMTVIHGEDIWFSNNRIDKTGQTAFDFEPDAPAMTCSRISVVGNTIGTRGAAFLAAKGAAPVNDVYVADNTSSVEALTILAGSQTVRQGRWVVTNNRCPVLYGSSTRYFDFGAMDDVEVTGNVVAEEFSGVRINNCSNVRVIGNTFSGAQQALEVVGPDNPFYLGPSWDYVAEDNTL